MKLALVFVIGFLLYFILQMKKVLDGLKKAEEIYHAPRPIGTPKMFRMTHCGYTRSLLHRKKFDW